MQKQIENLQEEIKERPEFPTRANLDEKVKEIKQELDERLALLEKENLSHITKLKEETTKIKQKLDDTAPSPTYAEIVEKIDKKSKQIQEELQKKLPLSVENQKARSVESTENVISEMAERENRKRNILVFGVKESTGTTQQDRIKTELETVKRMIRQVDNEVPLTDLRVFRLGAYNENRIRPIKVLFPTKDEALKVLRNKNKVPEGALWYIKYDQTSMERAHLKQVLATLEERKIKGETNLKVKYMNGVPKIVKGLEPEQVHLQNLPKNC